MNLTLTSSLASHSLLGGGPDKVGSVGQVLPPTKGPEQVSQYEPAQSGPWQTGKVVQEPRQDSGPWQTGKVEQSDGPWQSGKVDQTRHYAQLPTAGSPTQEPVKESWFKRNAKLVGAVAGAAVLGGIGFLTLGPIGGIGGAVVGALAGSFLVGKLQGRRDDGPRQSNDGLPPLPPSGNLPPPLPR